MCVQARPVQAGCKGFLCEQPSGDPFGPGVGVLCKECGKFEKGKRSIVSKLKLYSIQTYRKALDGSDVIKVVVPGCPMQFNAKSQQVLTLEFFKRSQF